MGLLQAVGQGIGGLLGINPQQVPPSSVPIDYSQPDGVGIYQAPQPSAPAQSRGGGLLGEFGQDAANIGRGLLSLPGNAVQAYSAEFAATPQNLQLALAQRAAQLRQMQATWQAIQAMPDGPAKVAAMLNPGEYGKALASNYEGRNVAGGDSALINGQFVTAPKLGVDEKSGTAYVQGPGGVMPQGQFGGDITTGNGLITSGRTGVQGTYSTPQKLAPGEAPGSFTPAVAGATPGFTPVGSPAVPPPSPVPTSGAGGVDPMRVWNEFIAPHEGGLNPADMNGSPTNFGINQAANPGVDVTKLTKDQAGQIFAQKYFGPSGAANLPAGLGAMVADTAFINPRAAQRFLQQSGGDPAKFMQLRRSWMDGMIQHNPAAAKYARAWATRNNDLEAYAGSLSSGGAPASPAAPVASGWSVGSPTGAFRDASPQELADKGYAPGTRAQISPTGEIKVTQTPQTAGNYSDQDKARMGAIASEAEAANQYASQARQFVSSAGNSANPIYHVPGADIVGSTFNPKLRSLENLGTQMATTLRAPGMRMTQMEFQKFGEVSPSIENTTESNAQIAAQAQQLAQWKQQKATFYQDWIAKNGNLNGADAAWDQHEAQVLGGQTAQQNAAPTSAAPQVGYVNAKGFQYLGANPRNPAAPENWRKVR